MNNYFDYSDSDSDNESNYEIDDINNEIQDNSFIINNRIINNISFIRQRLQLQEPYSNTIIQSNSYLSDFINTSINTILNEINENNTFMFNTDFDDFIENLILEDVKVTLSNEQLDKLIKIKLDQNNIINYNNNCSICLESFNLNEELLVLKCNHYFHHNCIHPWLTKESTKCPTCRHPNT
jgi:hypothetical protein